MADGDLVFRGGCLCGGARFEARGRPAWVGLCHCASCRRATGGTLVAAAGFAKANVRLDGRTLAHFASSPGVLRSFCSACGTSLAYQSAQWPNDIHLMAGALDAPETLRPEFHIFAAERLAWLQLADDLPRYRTTPGDGDLLDPV
jgi:hypothetical protein